MIKENIMATYYHFGEFGANLIVTTIEEEMVTLTKSEERKNALRTFVTSGGGFCFNAAKEVLDGMRQEFCRIGGNALVLDVLKPGPTVVMLEDFFEHHTDDEIRAIMLHEMGHAVNGDCNIEGVVVNTVNNLYVNTDVEIRADKFAAERTSPSVVASAIKKCLKAQAKLIAAFASPNKRAGIDQSKLYKELLSDEVIQERLAKLV